MSEYDYVTCGPREARATTGPPTYNISPKLSDDPIDYVYAEPRNRANAFFLNTSKGPEIEKYRKKSVESSSTSKTFPCLKYIEKRIGKKSNTSPKQSKQTKQNLSHSRTSPRQIMSIPSLTKSKSVEDLEETFPSQLTPLQVPLNVSDTDSLKSKSSSMNFLHMIHKPVTAASPLANNDNAESNHTRPLPFPPPSSNSPPPPAVENIYEELDEPKKKEILQESDFPYVVFQSGCDNKMRTEVRSKVDTRPPAPLPHLTLGANQTNTPRKHLTRDNNRPIPPQKPIQITSKLTENILNNPRAQKHPPVPEKPVLVMRTYKEEQARDFPNAVMDNSRIQLSDIPTTISSLTHQSSLRFTIPINLATSIPLYSLQRSQDITSEIQTVTDLFVNDFSDGDFTDDEESLLFNFESNSANISKGLVMETSLSSVESTDYATYDRILRVINKFSKQATLAPSKDVEYVTYDNVINLTRSHSDELGYVTTEMLRGNQAKSSLPNTDIALVEYINTQHTQSTIVQTKTSPNRPNKMPKPQPRNTPKPTPRAKPVIYVKSPVGNNVPTHNIIARTASYEDPGYVGEEIACLQPDKPGREALVQSYHEYADSQILDSVPISCDGSFPGQQFFKSSRRRKSILKQSRTRKSRESIYTNYTDTSSLLRSSQKRNYADDCVKYDYVYPIELRIPFRVSWAPLFFNDDFSYVPNMEVPKLLSALNVTNHINRGWDFDQYSTVVNSKAAVRPPPPIYPKTDSLLRENNKRFTPFRPSLNCTPEDENVVSIARRNRAPLLSRPNRISFRASFPILSNTSTNSIDSVFEEHLCGLSILSTIHSINKRGKFPSKPMLPPSKEQPELHSSMPVTTSGRVDEKGESIPRSLSASKIELAPSEDSKSDLQSHTLDRYHQKQKKLRQNVTDFDDTTKKELQKQNSLDQEKAVFTRLPDRQPLKREKFEICFSTTILLQEENVIKIPSSAVSLRIILKDTSYIAKEIEFVIKIFANYSYWESKLDTSKKAWFREKSVNLSPIVSISCKTRPPPNLGTMLLTIPLCGQLGGWVYHLCQKDVDFLYGSERKDSYGYKLCDDRVEISTPLFGYYCIKGEYIEKKQVCIKKVVFIAFRGLFNQNKILIGMSNDTSDDIKLYKEEMHDRHYRAIKTEPCPYLLSHTTAQLPLRVSLKIDGKTELSEMEIPFMTAWKMVPNSLSGEDAPPTPSCVFTLPSPTLKIDFTVRHGHKCVHYALNT